MFDASGGYTGGFFQGENFRLSNPDACYELNDQLREVLEKPLDDITNVTTLVVPFFVNLVFAKYQTSMDGQVC